MSWSEKFKSAKGRLSQAKMARLIDRNLSVRTVQDWEQGRSTPPVWVQRLVLGKIKRLNLRLPRGLLLKRGVIRAIRRLGLGRLTKFLLAEELEKVMADLGQPHSSQTIDHARRLCQRVGLSGVNYQWAWPRLARLSQPDLERLLVRLKSK